MFIEGGARVDALRQEGHVVGISSKFRLPGHIALLTEGGQVTTRFYEH